MFFFFFFADMRVNNANSDVTTSVMSEAYSGRGSISVVSIRNRAGVGCYFNLLVVSEKRA